MAEVAVGTAKILLNMDSSNMEVVLQRMEQKQRGLGDAAVREGERMTVAQRRVVDALERATLKTNMSSDAWLRYRIMTQTTGETQKALLANLDANTAGIQRQTGALQTQTNVRNAYGLTMKQEIAAMRQVPAQMTDIFVSLQGGQNPMTVLIQQGGQLKDVFGGVVPAAKALGAGIAGLINPITIVGAAVGTLGLAWYQGESEARSFNAAIINSGNYAGTTAAELQRLAESMDGIAGVTQRGAASALSTMVATGRIASDQLEAVTEAALRMESVGGQSIEDTAKAFTDIGRDPVNAIMRLNESMNFLDRSTLANIMTLQEQGRTQEAVTAATEAYADAIISRSSDISENLGFLERGWRAIANTAKEAWDEMLGFGRSEDPAALVASAQARIAALQAGNDYNTKYWSESRRQREIDRLSGVVRDNQFANVVGEGVGTMSLQDTKAYQDAFKGWESATKGARTETQRLNDELDAIAEQGKVLGKTAAEIQQLQAAARAKSASKGPKGDGGMGNAMSKAELQAIKDYESIVRGEITNTGKVLQAEYAARLVSESEYFQQRRALAERDFQAQESSLVQQIAALRGRDAAGKDAVNTSRELGKLEAELAKVRADHATQQTILGIQEDDLTAKRQRAIDGYREALEMSNDSARMSVEAALSRIMMGEREAEQQQRISAVIEDGARKRRALEKELAETRDEDAYNAKLRELENFVDEQVRIVTDGYDRMREAQADWMNGLRAGWENWRAGAQDVAGQIEKITVNSLNAGTDALTEFAMTSKITWRDMLLDLGEQIVRFMMQQAVLEFASAFLGMWGGSGSTSTTTSGGMQGFKKNALGDTYSGSPSLSRYSGSVVNQPTPFYFARGAGVMGEAGPEGIFPLQRGSDGKLGVKASGGGGAPVTIITNVNVQPGGAVTSDSRAEGEQAGMYKGLADNMSNVARQEIHKATMPGGILWKARAN